MASPLIEVNATLLVQDDSSFSMMAPSCDIYLDDLLVKEVVFPSSSGCCPFSSSFIADVFSFCMRCAGRNPLPSIQFSSLEQNWTQPILTSPRSRFSFLFPVFHCTVNHFCENNSLLFVPDGCIPTLLTPLPYGFILTENGTLAGVSEEKGIWEVTVGCMGNDETTDIRIIVEGEYADGS